jgi:heme/copper-type cytochrome/quinol oxidase subunit 1
MHGTVMMFLFAIPLIEGFALYMLPKVLGARDLAFPRLSAFGYWCYLFGGLILLACAAGRNSARQRLVPLHALVVPACIRRASIPTSG